LDSSRFELTVLQTRIVFPYIFLIGLAALGTAALQARKRFAVPAWGSALLNVPLIAAPFMLVGVSGALGWPPITCLAMGALLGGALQVAVQLPALRRAGLPILPRWPGKDPYVKKALVLMAPLLVTLGVYELNVLLSNQLASYLPVGSRGYLYFGQRIVEMPQGMFALAIASATLPTLSELRARNDSVELLRTFRYSLRLALFVAVPATVLLMVIAEPTVTMLYGRGEFAGHQIAQTARSLVWQAAGIWAVASIRSVVQVFYACNDTRSPVFCSAINLVTYGAVAVSLMGPLLHVGLAMAISAASVMQLLGLVLLLRRRMGPLGFGEVWSSVWRIALASFAAGMAGFFACVFGDWSRGGNDITNWVVFLGALVASVGVYFAVARAVGSVEVRELLVAVRRRRNV